MGERFTTVSRPGPRLVEGLSQGSRALQDIVPSLFPGPSRRRPESASYLTLHLMTTDPWLNHFPNGHSLTVGFLLGRGAH